MPVDHPLTRVHSHLSSAAKVTKRQEDSVKEQMVQAGRIPSHPKEARTLDNEPVDDWTIAWPPPPAGMPLPRVKPQTGVSVDESELDKTSAVSPRKSFTAASSAGSFKMFESAPVFQLLRASSFRSVSGASLKSFKGQVEDEEEMPAWMKRGSTRSLSSTGSRLSRNSGSFGSNPRTPRAGQSEDEGEELFFGRTSSSRSGGSGALAIQPGSTGSISGLFEGLHAASEDSPTGRGAVKSPKSLGSNTKSILKRVSSQAGVHLDDSECADFPSNLVGTKQLLANLSQAQQNQLRTSLKPKTFKSGEHVLRKGDEGSSMFFLISGSVKVEADTEDAVLGTGMFFGEMSVIKRWMNRLYPSGEETVRRTADVSALSDGRLLELDGDQARDEQAISIFKDDGAAWPLLLSMNAVREGAKAVLIPVI